MCPVPKEATLKLCCNTITCSFNYVSQILEEDIYPWLNLIKIELTTFLPTIALRHTFFNIIHHPMCLQFPNTSMWSGSVKRSYQKLWSFIYSEFELKRKKQVIDDAHDVLSRELVTYEITIKTNSLNDGTVPPVDIAITLSGMFIEFLLTRLIFGKCSL